jgi:tetratricopeptide (TPR) repeat protein
MHPRLAALLLLGPLGAFAAGRPRVDPQALGEAIRASREAERPPASSASYAHFLRARLLHDRGEHRAALDELRLARVTDPGSPGLTVAIAEEWARLGEPARAEAELRPLVAREPAHHGAQLLLGRVLLEQRKHARAQLHLRRACALRPEDPSAWLARVQLHVELGQYDQAALAAEGLAAARDGETVALRRLGAFLAAQGLAARAEPLLQRAVQLGPSDVKGWLELARFYEATGRTEQAREAWSEAFARDPSEPEAMVAAARQALEDGEGENARSWFGDALVRERSPEPWARAAAELLAARQHAHAASLLDEARELGISEPRLAYYAGLVYERLREHARAEARYAEVPASSPMGGEAAARRAGCLSRQGRHAEALAALRSLEGHLSPPALAMAWARALERSGDAAQARARLERALQAAPADSLHAALGGVLLRAGHPAAAVEALERGTREFPDSPGLQVQLAAARARAGDAARARTGLERWLAAHPDSAPGWAALGRLAAEAGGNLAEAERWGRRAVELAPGEASPRAALACVLVHRGELTAALSLLAEAAAVDPDEPAVHEHLGDALLAAGKPSDAATAFRKALSLLEDASDDGDAARVGVVQRKLKGLSPPRAGR